MIGHIHLGVRSALATPTLERGRACTCTLRLLSAMIDTSVTLLSAWPST
jgi:hypothetical protein